jgi:hypothetical protein
LKWARPGKAERWQKMVLAGRKQLKDKVALEASIQSIQ